jgi:hypothetical protein
MGSAGTIAIRLMEIMISSSVSKVKRQPFDAGVSRLFQFTLAVCSWFPLTVTRAFRSTNS